MSQRIGHPVMRDVAKRAAKHGWTWKFTGRGHLKFIGPAGQFVFCAATPGDQRAIRQIEQDFRHKGIRL